MDKLARYYHTVRPLKSIQVLYQVLHRIRPASSRAARYRLSLNAERNGFDLKLTQWIEKNRSLTGDRSFRFINIESEFTDWNDLRNGMLWNYNLNYMDWLCQEKASAATGLEWIERFIHDLPHNRYGLDPYPLSVRCINWIKFLAENRPEIPLSLSVSIDRCLYAQYRVLAGNPEFHLMGNHLFVNGVSLLFGAFYFRDSGFYLKSLSILDNELDEQILSDGGHFELSPMYHQMVLEYLLDCINLIGCNERIFPEQEKFHLKIQAAAGKMLGWLEKMTLPDGKIPLFNDSAEAISPDSRQLNEYAYHLGIVAQPVELSDSGYRIFSGVDYTCIADAGRIGPGYIPGHAHADTFSFVLSVGSRQYIADTGVSTYEKNETRQAERGTAAHNTVSVNGLNSSDVWGGFRVGRKANVSILKDTGNELVAVHDGFMFLGVAHRRQFRCESRSVTITDTLTGGSTGTVSLHFYPGRKITIEDSIMKMDDYLIHLSGFNDCRLAEFNYHPEFNISLRSVKFEGTFRGSCEMKIVLE